MTSNSQSSLPPGSSLRTWLRFLADRKQLSVQDGLALEFEMAAAAKAVEKERAILFADPADRGMMVAANLFTSRDWVADAMGVPPSRLTESFLKATENPLPTKSVTQSRVHDVSVTSGIDLTKQLPIPTHNEHDSGPYITAALLIVRDPETGHQNVSIHRCQISGPDRIGVLLLPRQAHALHTKAEKSGKPLPMALAIGASPLAVLASQAIVPLGQDELEIAGALQGSPLEVVRSKTVDIDVPADSEIVVEGHLLPEVREPEGPFGEFPQYYGPRNNRQVIEVSAICRRSDAIFHTITGGNLEHLLLGAIPREATLLSHLRRTFPNVEAVHLPTGGVCRYHLVVRMNKRADGEPKNVMMGAFAGHYDVKQVVICDPDVDIFDPDEVEWAVATRFQADRDLLVVENAQGSKLDPSARGGLSTKLGLDATKPMDAEEMAFKRIRVPGIDKIDVASVMGSTISASDIAV